jgi:peptide/nickel transport system permease protein
VPSWGNLIADARGLEAAWWVALFPGLALVVTVVACGLIGDALRDRLDPRGGALAS